MYWGKRGGGVSMCVGVHIWVEVRLGTCTGHGEVNK